MILLIFDIDGTLTDTTAVDYRCYEAAFKECFGIDIADTDWESFTEFTDLALLRDIYVQRTGKNISAAQEYAFQQRFIKKVQAAVGQEPQSFQEIEGASQLMRSLIEDRSIGLVMATGGYGTTARLKLDAAGIPCEGVPLANSDRWASRVDIVKDALRLSKVRYRTNEFEKVIMLGDGLWDLRTAQSLSFPLIGVGPESSTLSKTGHLPMFENFLEPEKVKASIAKV